MVGTGCCVHLRAEQWENRSWWVLQAVGPTAREGPKLSAPFQDKENKHHSWGSATEKSWKVLNLANSISPVQGKARQPCNILVYLPFS